MQTVNIYKKPSNRLLQILVGISLCIHGVVFMHISGLYNSKTITYIEFMLQDVSKPFTRNIPRAAPRPKIPEKFDDIKKIRITPQQMPRFKPMEFDPLESDLLDGPMEKIDLPAIPSVPGIKHVAYNVGEIADTADEFTTPRNYLDMVMFRIETHKKYPNTAKTSHIEGRVTISFIIMRQGNISKLNIVKSSSHQSLDKAALQAVKDAAPFPSPPPRFFASDIPLELNIVFEIT